MTRASLRDLQLKTRWSKADNFLVFYESVFEHLRDKPVKLLELGISEGSSLYLWRDYFEKGAIAGLDILPFEAEDETGRIRTYQGGQQDTALLDRIAAECAPEGFDIIIDDAAHIGYLARISFWHLLENHLKPGGIFIIEDWGVSYWPKSIDGKGWKDQGLEAPWLTRVGAAIGDTFGRSGARFVARVANKIRNETMPKRFRSHDHGMVGFVKELIDESGRPDYTDTELGGIGPKKPSRFAFLIVRTVIVMVVKAIPGQPFPPLHTALTFGAAES